MTTTTATTMLTISEYWALYLVKLGDHRVDGRHCARRAVGLPRRSWAVSSEAPTSGRRPWREARAAKPRTSLLLVMSRSPWAISFSMLSFSNARLSDEIPYFHLLSLLSPTRTPIRGPSGRTTLGNRGIDIHHSPAKPSRITTWKEYISQESPKSR